MMKKVYTGLWSTFDFYATLVLYLCRVALGSRLAAVKITTYFLCMSRKELEVQLLYIYTECPSKSLYFTR